MLYYKRELLSVCLVLQAIYLHSLNLFAFLGFNNPLNNSCKIQFRSKSSFIKLILGNGSTVVLSFISLQLEGLVLPWLSGTKSLLESIYNKWKGHIFRWRHLQIGSTVFSLQSKTKFPTTRIKNQISLSLQKEKLIPIPKHL